MASINGLQTNGLQTNTIDGLTTIYATSIYDNGVLVDPTAPPNIPVNPSSSTSVCFPIFTTNNGAQTSAILLTDASISTPLSYKPSTGNLYTYALQVGSGINAGFLPVGTPASTNYLGVDGAGNIVRSSVPTPSGVAVLSGGTSGSPQQFTGYNQFTSTLKLGGVVFSSTPSSGTVSSYLAIDSANNLISTTSSGASLTAGTSGSPQQFTGYNQFLAQLKLSYVVFSSTPPSGTPSYYLAVDSANNLISTTSSGASLTAGTIGSPQQFTGYNQFTSTLKLSSVVFTSAPASGTVSSYLALDSANNLITTTSASVPTQINPTNLATGTLYPVFFSSHTGGASLTVYVDPTSTTLSYAPSTGTLTATAFVGPLTGAVTGALTGTVNGLTLGLGGGSVSSNIAIGSLAQSAVNTNINNVAIGPSALTANTGGGANIAIGQQALSGLITGNNNIGIGIQAGNNLATTSASANNIYIGTSTSASATVVSNEIVIGYNIGGLGANTVNLGSTTKTVYANNFNANTSVNTSALRSTGNMIITSGYGVGTTNTIYFYANGTPLGSIDNTGWNLSYYTLFCSTITSQSTYDLTLKGVSGYVNLLSNATTIAQITPTGLTATNLQTTLIQSSSGNGGVASSAGLNIVGYNSTLGASYINFWSSNATNTGLVRMGYTGNGLGWCFEVGTGAVVSSVTSSGFNTNNVKSFASTDLTLNGQSGNVNIQCSGTQYYAFTAAALTLAGTGQGIYCDRYIGLNGNARQIMTASISAQYTALYNAGMGNCVYNPSTWNTGGYHLFTSVPPSSSCYALAAYHNGSYGGIMSLGPGYAWTTLELEGAQVNVFCYGGLAVYTTGGAWVTVSDERIKTNIRPLKTDRSLQRVLQAQTMTYNKIHKDPIAPDSVRKIPHVGVIAQQVKTSNPHCISTWDDEGTEMYGVNYQDYTIHLIGAVQEQQKQIEQQQNTIQAMAQHITTLTDTINKLLEKYPL